MISSAKNCSLSACHSFARRRTSPVKDGVIVLITLLPFLRTGRQAFPQPLALLRLIDAHKPHLLFPESLLPARLRGQDAERLLDVLLPLHLVAVVNPVQQAVV